MKTKDIIQLIVALLILAVAGYLLYSLFVPHSSSKTSTKVTYVKVTPVDPNFDQTSLSQLDDGSKVHNFYSPPDLNNGLNNPQPFGPLH